MRSNLFLLAGLICLILVSLACGASAETTPVKSGNSPNIEISSSDVLPKGNRHLEIHITEAEKTDYDQSLSLVQELGSESISLSVFWDDIEQSPGIFNPDPNWLEIANLYYPPQGMPVSLVISVLDTTETRVPDHLKGKSFSDPEMISGFKNLLDYIKTQIPDLELTSLAIGNEIDGVLGQDPQAWEEYHAFFNQAAAYARGLWPDVPVGTKVMFDGLTGPMAESVRKLYQASDVVMVTYYPLNGDFTVRDPCVIREDFDQLCELFPEKEIHITEIGYPSSSTNHSSPEKQAEFIRNMFAAWDEHASQITLLSYSWLTDLPQSSVLELEEYYGLTNPGFGEFLRTLGLRTYPGEGEDKPGYEVFQAEATARGW